MTIMDGRGPSRWLPMLSTRLEAERVSVRSEPLTYDRRAPRSYLQDLALAIRQRTTPRRRSASSATARRWTSNSRNWKPRSHNEASWERRVNPDVTTGTGGYFAPLWAIEQFATTPPNSPVGQDPHVPRSTRRAVGQPPATDHGIIDTGHTGRLPRLGHRHHRLVGHLTRDRSRSAGRLLADCSSNLPRRAPRPHVLP